MSQTKQVVLAQKFQPLNDKRCVVFSGREHLALMETSVAVPYAIIKLIAADLARSEAAHELQALGMPVNQAPPV